MTQLLLLVGAGFSHNWGGRLASEVFNTLLGDAAVQGDSEIGALLWRHQRVGGFEAALAELQRDARSDPALSARKDVLEGAIRRVFERMNAAFFNLEGGFEFHNHTGWLVRELLVRFDAIFSLNQDLLLERHYIDGDNIALTGARRWQGAALPGVRWPMPRPGFLPGEWVNARWRVDGPVEAPKHMQPVYKLHGSSAWIDANGRDLLVLGGSKGDAIAGSELLAAYSDEFERRLAFPDTRLMIIGYGFGDAHINAVMAAAASRGLKIFIVDPAGATIVDRADETETLRRMVIGASSRALRETFAGDVAERDLILSFFAV